MSRDIGTNTDPLDVEIYIEDGLIKGRIIMNNKEMIVEEPKDIVVKTNHLLNDCCINITIINPKRGYDFQHETEMLKFDDNEQLITINYQSFDYRIFSKLTGIENNRQQLWMFYQNAEKQIKQQLITMSSLEMSYLSAMRNIILNAQNNQYDEVLIILTDLQVISSNVGKFEV